MNNGRTHPSPAPVTGAALAPGDEADPLPPTLAEFRDLKDDLSPVTSEPGGIGSSMG